MAIFFDNFNFDPVDNKESSASYTVPGGAYAIVTVQLSAAAHSTFGGDGYITAGQGSVSGTSSFELRLKAGSILTKVESPSSSTTGAIPALAHRTLRDIQLVSVSVDGVVVGILRVPMSATYSSDAGGGIASLTGYAEASWSIAEYNKQGN